MSGYRDPESSRLEGPRCPRCGQGLVREQYGDTEVDECASCGGVFLDAAMMDRIVDASADRVSLSFALPDRQYRREREVRYVRCPRCNEQMARQIFARISGIIIDSCRGHGVWFDAGELSMVLAFIDRGGLEKAKKRIDEERAEREKQVRVQRIADFPRQAMPHENHAAVDLVDILLSIWR